MAEPIPLNKARRRQSSAPPPSDTEPPGEGFAACPITPLGHLDGKFYFLNIEGEKRCLSARQLGTRSELTSLFLGDMRWLQQSFKSVDEDGKPNGFKIHASVEALMSACRRAGIYGDHVVIRRPGVWAGEGNAIIAHCGDALFVGGDKFPAGIKMAGQIFTASARETYPAPHAAPCAIADGIQSDIRNLWNLRDDGGDIIAIGLVGQAYLAAALAWRANGFICGASNAGKSQLLTLLKAMVPLHHFSTDTSKAGLEGAINGRAVPSFIDESSDRGDGDGAQRLMDVVLSASSGGGTKGHRGTADGGVRSIEMVGSVIMASISPPSMEPQHRSRFSLIELLKPLAGADNRAPMEAAIARAAAAAPGLFARALDRFAHYQAALPKFRAALAKSGCVAREMDQTGAILAGHWILTQDDDLDDAAAAEMVKFIAAFIRGADEMATDDAPQRVLSMLLSRVVSLDRSTDQDSLASLIAMAMRSDAETGAMRDQACRVLERWGIRPIRATDIRDHRVESRFIPRLGPGNGLWIDARVEPLRKIFAETPYAGERWLFEILRLPHARRSSKNVRVGAMPPGKAVWMSWDEINKFIDEDDPP